VAGLLIETNYAIMHVSDMKIFMESKAAPSPTNWLIFGILLNCQTDFCPEQIAFCGRWVKNGWPSTFLCCRHLWNFHLKFNTHRQSERRTLTIIYLLVEFVQLTLSRVETGEGGTIHSLKPTGSQLRESLSVKSFYLKCQPKGKYISISLRTVWGRVAEGG